jgi:uncharacterized protein YndB with AHSA1/START domain
MLSTLETLDVHVREARTMTQHGRLGDLRLVREGIAVRYDRRLDATPAQVWDALTDPGELARWLGHVTVADRAVTVLLAPDAPPATGRVAYSDPEKMLEVDLQWPDEPPARFVAEIAELGSQRAIVVVEYRGVPEAVAAERAAEWHGRIEALAAVASGTAVPAQEVPPDLVASYEVALAELRSGG